MKLEGFLLLCEAVWGLAHPQKRLILLTVIRITKILGEVAKEICHMTVDTPDDLRSKLEERDGIGKSPAALQRKFFSLRPGAGENAWAYASRTRALLGKVIAEVCDGTDPEHDCSLWKRLREGAQMSFADDLKKGIRAIVLAVASRMYTTP